jgi:DNA-directed RNA polymerase subunit RPC12/RpoP
MKEVIDGCPYCGSDEGFERKQTVTRKLIFTANGTEDFPTDDVEIEKMSWQYPRCVKCGRKVIIWSVM